MKAPLAVVAAFLAVIPLVAGNSGSNSAREVKGKRGGGRPDLVSASEPRGAFAPQAPPAGFTPQVRLGYTAGDQWEPAIAADAYGSIYILYPQYGGVPGCPACADPTAILQVSRDRGVTWDSPRPIAPPGGSGQVDTQIAVDPVDGRTLYAAWLQNGKSDTVVARSDDLGASWNVVVADSTNAGTDKPILAVRGPDVYVALNHAQKIYVAASHDGGATFTNTVVNPNGKLGWSLAGGGTVDADGRVFFSWAGYEQNGGAKGKVNLFVSASTNGGASWTNRVLEVSAAPPDCSDYLCGWAYLGAQLVMAGDEAGTLYALWNSGSVAKGPERIYFARSTDHGLTWSARQDVSAAAQGVSHAFPAIVATSSGDVRISWMDARSAGLWNVYYRSSKNGGATWSAETDLSTYVAGFNYILPGGFSFPFGDYYEVDVDDRGTSHLIFGEGLNWLSPGSIWYVHGR